MVIIDDDRRNDDNGDDNDNIIPIQTNKQTNNLTIVLQIDLVFSL